MFFLIPKTNQDKIRKEYFARVFISCLLLLTFSVFIGILFLFPTYLLTVFKEKSARSVVSNSRTGDSSKTDVVSTAKYIRQINEIVGLLSADNLRLPSVSISAVFSDKIDGVVISEVTRKYDKSAGLQVVIGGKATDRATLFSFVKKLESDRVFAKIDVPVSNFTMDKDINFIVTAQERN